MTATVFFADAANEIASLQNIFKVNAPFQLQAARNLLLECIEHNNRACKFCHGTGRVRGRLGAQDCTMCRGTGDKQP